MEKEVTTALILFNTDKLYRVEVERYDITDNCITLWYIDPRTGTHKRMITALSNVILEFYTTER